MNQPHQPATRLSRTRLSVVVAPVLLCIIALPLSRARAADKPRFVDLSLIIASEYPCTWPSTGFPVFQQNHYLKIGPASAYNVDVLSIDGNTGTQLDVPPHSVARPELNLPHSGKFGNLFTDKVEAWQFGGEACVVDVRKLLDSTPNGVSSLVRVQHVRDWEKQHRGLRFGDVVLFRSDYSDKYYRPFPAGSRFIIDPLTRRTPGWPDPHPDCMDYLGRRGVLTAGTDSPSMGPLPNLAEPTHFAGLKYGMIWTEGATGLGQLPATGAFYCMLSPKHLGGPFSEGRAFAIVGNPLAARLIDSAHNKRAVDLSVLLSMDLPVTWPGRGPGDHRHPYVRADFMSMPHLQLQNHTHLMDSQVGTHLVPPAYALPPAEAANVEYAPEIRGVLEQYQQKYGPRGSSDMTTEKVPLDWTCGPARVIDVSDLVGSTDPKQWPLSPEITPKHVTDWEAEHGPLRRGDVVIFRSGHSDRFVRTGDVGDECMAKPLAGTSEGWPAPGPDTIVYLSRKGIRCVATDGPTLGGVDPHRALMTYWALGSRQMVGVEFLTNVQAIPQTGYFLFAPLKIRGCHGGPGRAIVLH